MIITAEIYKAYTGVDPRDDDLERCNCSKKGQMGHQHCGWDKANNQPVFYGPPLPLIKGNIDEEPNQKEKPHELPKGPH